MKPQRIVIAENLLPGEFARACEIINSMRYYRKRWEKHHGASAKSQMKFWEAKADEFLRILELEDEPENPIPNS